ncbi:MAG: Gfo/Idh/MocA family oxidoreductase [Armatimonadetes bacterium]|nr:Gfo/Idh/MocA family oxidoreductase [Armatimonadota bacterium]
MNPARIAVIGAGDFGARHLSVLSALDGAEVVALVSRTESRARELAERYGVPRTFPDTESLLSAVELDAVHVVTEDTRHFGPVMAALNAGLEVLVEKPLSHDLNEAREMVATAHRLGRKLMVGHILRFDTRCAAIKESIARGELGEVVSFYGRRNLPASFRPIYNKANRLYTTGIHDIDLLLWYCAGRKPVEVYMRSRSVGGDGDDVFWGMITMDDGAIGVIETAWMLPDSTPWRGHILAEVIGTKGTAWLEVPGNGLGFWLADRVATPDTSYWPEMHGTTVGALRDEIAYFVHCLNHDLPIEVPTHEEVLTSLEVAGALIQSAAEGRPVRLDM